jgi:TPR repeat protein
MMKRIEKNDPAALRELVTRRYHEGDYGTAIEYWANAVELGDVGAHFQLSCMHRDGIGVEKDEKKEIYHLVEAAIGGHPTARNNLACYEDRNGRYERAVQHWIIAANLGHDDSNKI